MIPNTQATQYKFNILERVDLESFLNSRGQNNLINMHE